MNISTVMMIDDNEGDHFLLEMLLDEVEADIEMISAYDGEQALKILEEADTLPDIIFLDINMPGMNGLEFLEVYSQRGNMCSVICMLTSSQQPKDKATCEQYEQVKGYYSKPITLEDLMRIDESLSR